MSAPPQQLSPSRPYPGIEPFQFTDQSVFFARASDVGSLMQYVNVYRAVLCHGDSGAGKSSLINAGLIPEAIAQGFCPDRFRVQPTPGEEFVVERVSASLAGQPPFLPSILADDDTTSRFVLSGEVFEQKVKGWTGSSRPLLIFDQFEELITLFEEAPVGEALRQAQRAKEGILRLLTALITDPDLHVKLLFSFREDYLAKILRLFDFWPEIRDQYVRITPPSSTSLFEIIRGPFERYPDAFEAEIAADLAERIAEAMGARDERGMVNLSELQIALVRLWQSKDPGKTFEARGIQGLLEDYTSETLESIPPDLRASTVALLSNMITESGARNVISEEDLLSRVEEIEGIPRDLLKEALRFLEQDARLIRREHRHEVAFYEIVSEFLAPWITRQREQAQTIKELQHAQVMAAEVAKKRLRRVGLAFLILIPLVVIPFALFAVAQKNEAARQRDIATVQRNKVEEKNDQLKELARTATSLGLAAQSLVRFDEQPDLGFLLAIEALKSKDTLDARGSLLSALQRFPGLSGVLRPPPSAVTTSKLVKIAYDAEGGRIIGVDRTGRLLVWDTVTGEQLVGSPTDRSGRPTSIALSPDGGTVAVGTLRGEIYLWDLTDGEPNVRRLAGHMPRFEHVENLAFDLDGEALVVLTGASDILRWDVDRRSPLETRSLPNQITAYNQAMLTPDGRLLASSVKPGTIAVTDLSTGRVTTVHDGQALVKLLALSDDGSRLAWSTNDAEVGVLNLSTGARTAVVGLGDVTAIKAITFDPEGETLAIGSRDAVGEAVVSLAHAADGRVYTRFAALAAWPRAAGAGINGSIVFSPDGRTLAVMSPEANVWLWHTKDREPIAQVLSRAHLATVSPDGSTLAVFRQGTVVVTDVASGRSIGELHLGPRPLDLTFNRDASMLAITDRDRSSQIWSLTDTKHFGDQPIALPVGYDFLGFGPEPNLVAVAKRDEVELWDTSLGMVSGPSYATPSRGSEWLALAFSPDGTMLALGDQQAISISMVGSGEVVSVPDFGLPPPTPYFFFVDGTYGVASSDESDTIVVENAAMTFSSDGETLIAGTQGAARAWSRSMWKVAIPQPRSRGGVTQGPSSP
jgi:WD40 repeat protein